MYICQCGMYLWHIIEKVCMCKCQCQMYFWHMYKNIGCIFASVGCIYGMRKRKKTFCQKYINCKFAGCVSAIAPIISYYLVGVLDRFLVFKVFFQLLFKIESWNFQGLLKFTFYIFPQSFIKIYLLVVVLDRFLDFHTINY